MKSELFIVIKANYLTRALKLVARGSGLDMGLALPDCHSVTNLIIEDIQI